MKKSLFKSTLAGFIACCSVQLANGQASPAARACISDSMMAVAMQQDPGYAQRLRDLDAAILKLGKSPDATKARNGNEPYIIPVVVHIIHTYTSDHISDAQVEDAIRIVNEDFMKTNADTGNVIQTFKNIYAKMNIEFRLARIDDQGNPTRGITRTFSNLTNAASDNVKSLVRWDTGKYLNIWVVDNVASGAGGYSYRPCVSSAIDGIVVRNRQFGSIGRAAGAGNLSARTMTHEIGHYLGLPHTWGSSNTPGLASNCSIDDGIADTPNCMGVADQRCNLNLNTCDVGQPGDLVDNVQNYMDYSSCGIMFTEGQKQVVHDALQLSCRASLWDSTNLAATGTKNGFIPQLSKPIADFWNPSQSICEGSTITFQDKTYNAIIDSTVSYSWTFPGGSPSTSTDRNPAVRYDSAGVFSAKLVVSNAAGTDSLVRTDFIKVRGANAVEVAPLAFSFENADFPADSTHALKTWFVEDEYQQANTSWKRTTTAATHGAASVSVINQQIISNKVSRLITPVMSFANVASPAMMFDLAYAKRFSAGGDDELKIFVSRDCGRSWIQVYSKAGAALSTVPNIVPRIFVPAANEWRTETVNLPMATRASNILLKFECTSKNGNALYIDNIRFGERGAVGLAEEFEANLNLNVYPNPSNGNAFISFNLLEGADVSIEVSSVTGQKVAVQNLNTLHAGKHELSLRQLAPNTRAGMYLVKLTINGRSFTRKAVIY